MANAHMVATIIGCANVDEMAVSDVTAAIAAGIKVFAASRTVDQPKTTRPAFLAARRLSYRVGAV
jgi:hypothetical protein